MARYNRFMGEYNENTTYEKGDVVTFDGAAYYRKMPGSGISPIARKKPYTVWSRLNEDLSTIFPLGGGTGTGLPSDVGAYKYMATDGNGEWIPADRLAWKEPKRDDVIEEKTVNFKTSSNGMVHSWTSYDEKGYLIPGNKYTVIFDGVVYPDIECIYDDYFGYDSVGNLTLYGNDDAESNGYPFCILTSQGGGYCDCYASTGGEHSLSVYGMTETTHPIPAEYLPEVTWQSIAQKPLSNVEVSYKWGEKTTNASNGVAVYTYFYPYTYSECADVKPGLLMTVNLGDETYKAVMNGEGTEDKPLYLTIPGHTLTFIPNGTDSFDVYMDGCEDGVSYTLTLYENYIVFDWRYIPQAIGYGSEASGEGAYAIGYGVSASGEGAFAEGEYTNAEGKASHVEGYKTVATGLYAHSEGENTIAAVQSQHVQGKYNVEDTNKKYAHIVGNGTSNSRRANAHTLDWDGNAWYAGTVEGTGMIVKSSTADSTKRFLITVDDSGTISATEVTE